MTLNKIKTAGFISEAAEEARLLPPLPTDTRLNEIVRDLVIAMVLDMPELVFPIRFSTHDLDLEGGEHGGELGCIAKDIAWKRQPGSTSAEREKANHMLMVLYFRLRPDELQRLAAGEAGGTE